MFIALLAVVLHAGGLDGPFTDGQNGNCGAMFALFARNEAALGLRATLGVPVVNPVPPSSVATAEFYTHHPPGLPWLVMLASRLPFAIETSARLVALLATIATTLLLADLATRLAGRHAGLAAALLALLLPASLHDGLLVNYETLALPALLALLRALLLERPRAWIAAAVAALCDFVALLPLLFALPLRPRRSWWLAASAAAAVVLACALLARAMRPSAVAGTLAQGLAATFLARDFVAADWLGAMREHLLALFGWSLAPAALAVVQLPRRGALLRRALLWLLAAGAFNVMLFARHATGHEHFSLLLLPYVVLSTATLLFPREEAARPPTAVGALLLIVLLTLSWQQYREAAPSRDSTVQARLADSLRAATDLETIYLRTAGAGLVFLQRCERYVAPEPVHSSDAAVHSAREYCKRFGLDVRVGKFALAVAPGEVPPEWAAGEYVAIERDGWRFYGSGLWR